MIRDCNFATRVWTVKSDVGGGSRLGWVAQVLAEPIQTVMRRYNVSEPYEKLKAFTRGQRVTKESMQNFVQVASECSSAVLS